jgi:cytochrome c oxidase cbb3-type subunit 3
MKFINYLESISGIGIFPMISLLIFFTFFILLAIKVSIMDKSYLQQMNNLPLEDDENTN